MLFVLRLVVALWMLRWGVTTVRAVLMRIECAKDQAKDDRYCDEATDEWEKVLEKTRQVLKDAPRAGPILMVTGVVLIWLTAVCILAALGVWR